MALGLLQGVTELVPVSSSAHLSIVPRLLGWRYARLGPAERKSFEVALHLGSAPALALAAGAVAARPRPLPLALTVLPPALAGFALERPIERHLGGPRTVAVAQLAGGAALWLADRAPGARSEPDAAAGLAARGVFMRVAGGASYAPLAAYRVTFGAAALAAAAGRR